jgi:hypothetical protein
LKEQLLHEQELIQTKIKDELNVEHNAVLSDLKEKHEIEKNLLLNEQKEVMLDQHSVVLMKLNEEFNKCKLELEEQLKLYTDKEWKDVEIQTDTCEKVYCAIQTTVPSYASVELQTESNIGIYKPTIAHISGNESAFMCIFTEFFFNKNLVKVTCL